MLEFTGERYVPDAANVPKSAVDRLRQEHLVRYLLAGRLVAGRDVLDFGSGEGYGLAMMAAAGARLAHGLDVSPEAIEHARAKYAGAGIEFFVGDVRSTRLQHSYDVITCFELIEHVDDQAAVIRNVKAHLRPDGVLIVSTPRPSDVYEKNEFHVTELTGEELASLVGTEFAHLRRCAQSNLMVSLAGEGRLALSGSVEFVEIAGSVTFDTADFAIIVASNDAAALAALPIGAVATVNDEGYLHNVERDNRVLFTAERNLLADVATLRAAESNLLADVAVLREAERNLLADVATLRAAERDMTGEIATLRQAMAERERLAFETARSLEASRQRISEVLEARERENESLRAELAAQLIGAERISLQRRWLSFLHPIEREGLSRIAAAHATHLLRAMLRAGDRLSHVTFLNGCPEGESKRYRIANVATAARLCGVRATVLELGNCDVRFREIATDLLVIFRTRFNPEVGRLIEDARRRCIPVIFDVDDLVFEPESVDFIGAVQGLNEEQKEFHRREVAAFRETLEKCDFATATTRFLAGRIEALGIPAATVPNTINRRQFAVAELERNPAGKPAGPMVRIGYFSGSPTHNKDFLEAAGALIRLLGEFSGVVLHIVGSVELDERFRGLAAQIRRHPFVPYLDMLRLMRGMDLVIAPLELNNPFTAGKSELKIFEAALVRVPCVASAVDSYRACIDNGKDGFVCSNEEEWYEALTALVCDEGRRSTMGEAAYRRFVPRFYIGNRIVDIIETYRGYLRTYRRRVAETGAK